MSLDKTKRIIGTALGFMIIGFCGPLMCVTVFPLMRLIIFNKEKRQYSTRGLVSNLFYAYLKILTVLGLFTIKIENVRSLKHLQGKLVICNHPSLLDVVIIMSCFKGIQCVVKSSLWKNPLLGGIVRTAGYLRNDTTPEIFLEKSKFLLEKGENILIFPEGTRSKQGSPLKLQRGVANLALSANVDIQALYLQCTPILLSKSKKWYHIPDRAPKFILTVGPLFKISAYQTGSDKPRSRKARALTADMQSYYNGMLGYE